MVYNQRPPPPRYTFILETVLVYLKVIAWRQMSFLQTFAVTACNSVSTNLCIKDICSAGIYLLRVNNRNTRTRCEICSKLTTKTREWRQWHRSGVFIVNFEHIPHLLLVFLLLTLNIWLPAGWTDKFEHQLSSVIRNMSHISPELTIEHLV